MPALVRLYIHHVAIGFALGLAFTALLLWLNIGNLWHLVQATDGGWIAVLMLVIFNGIVFSGVQFGYAIMRMAASDEPSGGKGARVPPNAQGLAEVRVAADKRR
ncbi:MAG: hypothetical protein KDE08_17675 [Rhodobacteraceae bacterium]|nr:hypothetical protein [Paracoccaceae bacterium]